MNELMAKRNWARIWEAKDLETPNENAVRIYRVRFPDVFAFQIRTFKPITSPVGRRGGKSRNMIAHVELSLTEMEQIFEFMKTCVGDSPRANIKPLELI